MRKRFVRVVEYFYYRCKRWSRPNRPGKPRRCPKCRSPYWDVPAAPGER
ncbi:MAG: hypothetical protein ACREQ9_20240 [Candidatus Binatia bacterium]